jgi:hypothetical protein
MAEHLAADGHEHGLCPILMREVQSAFAAEEPAGAARALAGAIRAVNRVMWEESRGMAPHKRLPLGLLAVAIDGNDAYICQIAAGQVFLARGGEWLALPDIDHWKALHKGALSAGPALGQTPELEPEIYHCRLADGDWIMLCATNLARLIDAETATRLAITPTTAAGHLCTLAEDFGLAATHGMTLQIAQTPAGPAPYAPLTLARLDLAQPDAVEAVRSAAAAEMAAAAQAAAERELAQVRRAEAVAAGATAPLTTRPFTGPLPENVIRLYRTPPLAPATPAEPGAAEPAPAQPAAGARPTAGRPSGQRPTFERPLRARWLDALAASLVLAGDAVRRGPPQRAARPRPSRSVPRRPAPRRPAAPAGGAPIAPEPVYRASSSTAAASVGSLADLASVRLTSLPWPSWSVPAAIALAVVTAALLLAAGISSLMQSGYIQGFGSDTPAVAEIVQQAREQRQAVTQTQAVDLVTARQTLEQVQTQLAQAEASNPRSEELSRQLAAEQAATQAALDTLTRTTRIGPVSVLADLSASGTSATTPKQLMVGNGKVYVLDPYANTLYLVDRGGQEPTPLLTKGWTIARQKVDDLLSATWRGDTLVVMDRQRAYSLDGPNGT